MGALRRGRCTTFAALGALVLGLAACGGGGGGGGGDRQVNASETPQITTAAAPAKDEAALLTEQDVHAISGFEGVVAAEVDDLPFYENPDPRGPCGGSAPALAFDGAFGRTFRSDRVQLIELVTPSSVRQKEQLTAYRGDVRPDCPPYDSRTNTGDTQHVSGISMLALKDLGVPAIGWASTIEVQGRRVQGGVVLAEVGERFLFLQFHALSLPPSSALQELARQAVDRLR